MNLQSEQIDAIVPALIKARKGFTAAVKDTTNTFFKSKYVTLDSVIESITVSLLDNGIYCAQQTDVVDGKIILYTRFLHASGQWIGGAYPVHPVKNDPQGEGSAVTYARRYALMALAGIAPEDDDGNAAVKAVKNQATSTLVHGNPAEGCWEQSDSIGWSREKICKIAEIAKEYWEMQDVEGALQYISAQVMPSEAKISLSTQFDSKFRAAMKKHHQENKAI